MEKKVLFLLDGHALVYRAHYAFINRPLINSKGINTSAINGFTRSLWDIISNKNPSHLAVAFDPKGGTFRHEMFPEYKANRDAQPEDITIALPYIKEIINALNIPIIEVPGFEADDTIGTIAKLAESHGFTVYMVTPDKDYAQLVSENIYMYKPARSGNTVDVLGVDEVLEKWDIERVDQVIDVLGLQGDSVDNIPGIPGVGAKTAVKLLKQFHSLEGILANTGQLKGKQKEKVETFADQGRLSKKLATIKTDVPVEFDPELYSLKEMNKSALEDIFDKLEFRSIKKAILGEEEKKSSPGLLFTSENIVKESDYAESKIATITNSDHIYVFVDNVQKEDQLISELSDCSSFCFDTETTGLDVFQEDVVGLAITTKKGTGYYIPLSLDRSVAKESLLKYQDYFSDPNKLKIGQNIKFDINILQTYGLKIVGPYFDTMIAHYLLEPDLRHKLDYLAKSYLNYEMIPIESLIGKRGRNQKNMKDIPPEMITDYAAEDSDITYQLEAFFSPKLKEEELTDLFNNVEMPLVSVLSQMESNGVKINQDFLKEYSSVLSERIVEKQDEIYKKSGAQFNIASPRQVGHILFDHLKIPYRWSKLASGQYSTNEEKLSELALKYEIVRDIMGFRKLSKLKSTYVDALPTMVNPKTGLIHSSFNQARAATGRLSSENPNLQNIPIKDEAGREIRKAFIPRDDNHILLAADYSQIELRIIADIANEKEMIQAFMDGIDIHRATAAGVYNINIQEVSTEQRRNAKTVNFSIIYGAGSTNLSRQLGISRVDAKELIDQYFNRYTGLKKYMENTVQAARDKGYVQTILGRKRYLRDINSRNNLARTNSERVAINTPIQGSAADMIKVAMINIQKEMKVTKMRSKMIMQVHDELVFDVYKPELNTLKPMIIDKMKNAIPQLKVPIEVSVGVGNNWLEAH